MKGWIIQQKSRQTTYRDTYNTGGSDHAYPILTGNPRKD